MGLMNQWKNDLLGQQGAPHFLIPRMVFVSLVCLERSIAQLAVPKSDLWQFRCLKNIKHREGGSRDPKQIALETQSNTRRRIT